LFITIEKKKNRDEFKNMRVERRPLIHFFLSVWIEEEATKSYIYTKLKETLHYFKLIITKLILKTNFYKIKWKKVFKYMLHKYS